MIVVTVNKRSAHNLRQDTKGFDTYGGGAGQLNVIDSEVVQRLRNVDLLFRIEPSVRTTLILAELIL